MIDLTSLTPAELCDLLHQTAEEIMRRLEEAQRPNEDEK